MKSLLAFALALVAVPVAVGCSAPVEEEGDEADGTGAAITQDERVAYRIVERFASVEPSSKTKIASWDLVVVEDKRSEETYMVAMAFDAERKEVVEVVIKREDSKFEVSFRSPDGGRAFPSKSDEERGELIGLLRPDLEGLSEQVKAQQSACEGARFLSAFFFGALPAAVGAVIAVPSCAGVVVTAGASAPLCAVSVGMTAFGFHSARSIARQDCTRLPD